jgi:tRNA threonylcarbamoyladenosine biosynthesis protein TsaB
MSVILSLETSTDVCSVALHENEKLIRFEEVHQEQAHASRLAPLIQNVLQKAGLTAQQLSAVAVTSGPGSYTGLRIGTSTAKGLCFALSIPLISVPTLNLLAFDAIGKIQDKEAMLCPMIDARRMEVYCQVFDRKVNSLTEVEAKVIDETSFTELLQAHPLFFFGNGSEKCRNVMTHHNAFFLDDIFPKASVLGDLACRKFLSKDFEDLINFTPFYLKDFVAKKGRMMI